MEELSKFAGMSTEDLGKKAEIVMAREHICNNNLKIDDSSDTEMCSFTNRNNKQADKFMVWKHPNPAMKKEFKIRNYQDVIAFHQSCLLTLEEINARNKESEEKKRRRLQENELNLVKIKQSLATKEYQKLSGSIKGFDNRSAQLKREEMADFRFMMAFGFGFITVMFMGFLTGFCLGKFILGWNESNSLMLALGTGIPTLILEAILMIIRLEKWEKKREMDRKAVGRTVPIDLTVKPVIEEGQAKDSASNSIKAGKK
jgi:hypothetical protein